MNNQWFGSPLVSIKGYQQIQIRMEYVKMEKLDSECRKYEINVIKNLICQIPQDDIRKVYERKLEELLC